MELTLTNGRCREKFRSGSARIRTVSGGNSISSYPIDGTSFGWPISLSPSVRLTNAQRRFIVARRTSIFLRFSLFSVLIRKALGDDRILAIGGASAKALPLSTENDATRALFLVSHRFIPIRYRTNIGFANILSS